MALYDRIGEACLLHRVKPPDGDPAGSRHLVYLLLRMGAMGVSQHRGSLDGLQGGLKSLFWV